MMKSALLNVAVRALNPIFISILVCSTVLAADDVTQDSELEEVTVTAQKREQSIQDVPVTITALSGDVLEAFNVNDLFEVAPLVPGMVFSRAPDDGLALTLRGLGTPARTQSFDQSIALFQNQVFVGKGRMYSAAFFDVERMEIIKGTQGTLLGKNSSLGAISIVSKKPGDKFGGYVRASAEFENGGFGADAAVDIPLGESTALRIAGHYADFDGWVKNLANGNDGPADEDLGVRATLLSTPTDKLTLTAVAQSVSNERQGNGFQFIDNGGWFTPPQLEIYGEAELNDTKTSVCPECPNGESFHDTDSNLLSLTIDYDFADSVFTSITSYAEYDLKFFDDFDFGNAFDEVTYFIFDPGVVNYYSTYFERDEDYDQFSQEFRLTSESGEKLEWMLGAFYFESDWTSLERQFWSTPNFPPPIPGQLFNGPFANYFSQETTTYSLFGHSTYSFTDELSMTFGLRYTDESKDVVFNRVQGTPATIWNSVLNPPFEKPLSFDDDFWNGNLSLQWFATDDIMLYTSYGVGTKTGGYAESAEVQSADPALPVNQNGARVETETAKTAEIGAKMTLADGAAVLNIALFNTDIDDFQETSFQVLGGQAYFLTRNIDAESKGIDIDGQWQLNESFRITGGATYADAKNSFDGTDLAQSPKLTGNIGLIYKTEFSSLGLFTARGFVRYRDKMYSQINETFPSDSLTAVDLTLGLIRGNWEFNLVGQNIFDEVVTDFSGPPAAPIGAITGAPPGDQGITSEAPSALRTISLQASYRF